MRFKLHRGSYTELTVFFGNYQLRLSLQQIALWKRKWGEHKAVFNFITPFRFQRKIKPKK